MLNTLFSGYASPEDLNAKWMQYTNTQVSVDMNFMNTVFGYIHLEISKIGTSVYFNQCIYSEQTPSIVTKVAISSPTASLLGGIYFYSNISENIDDILLNLLAQKAILDHSAEGPCRTINQLLLIFPLHQVSITLNVSSWSSLRYYNLLLSNTLSCLTDEYVQRVCEIDPGDLRVGRRYAVNLFGNPCGIIDRPEIGGHLALDSTFSADRPFQTFIGNPQTVDTLSDSIIPRLLSKRPEGAQWFVHAAYLINLANPNSNGVNRLISELRIANAIGSKGVVFHVGKYVSSDYNSALQNMINGMRAALQYATEATPLIIETPSGQGSEMGASLEGFCEILNQFPNELGRTLKVCVDTCHVFALGYNPADFIREIVRIYPDRRVIALVHFNDSQNPRGSRVDRHERCALGYIGKERMLDAYEFCKSQNIPMIIE